MKTDMDYIAEQCAEIDRRQGVKPTSSCMVDSVVSLKQNVSAVLQEALSGLDAWGDTTRFRDANGFVRWGLVEKEIHKFIDEANVCLTLHGGEPC